MHLSPTFSKIFLQCCNYHSWICICKPVVTKIAQNWPKLMGWNACWEFLVFLSAHSNQAGLLSETFHICTIGIQKLHQMRKSSNCIAVSLCVEKKAAKKQDSIAKILHLLDQYGTTAKNNLQQLFFFWLNCFLPG